MPQNALTVTDKDEQFAMIRMIVAEELELDLSELEDDKDFVDAYEADSLSLIQVFARIERELHVSVPQEEMNKMVDVLTTLEIVSRYAGGATDV